MGSPFDLALTDASINERIAPFWTIKDFEDTSKLLSWLNNAYGIELKQISKYREQCLKNLQMFCGKFYQEGTGRTGFAEASQQGLGIQSTRPSKLVVNHLYDLTMQRVSRITSNRPQVNINPANSEFKDKVSARIMKYWTDWHLYTNDFEALVAEFCQCVYIMGEAYMPSLWKSDEGELLDAWEEEEEAAAVEERPPRVPLFDTDGQPMLGEDGEELFIEEPVKTGEVKLEVWSPLDTIVQRCGDFYKANYYFHEEYVDIDDLKAEYKDSPEVGLIEPDKDEEQQTNFRNAAQLDVGPTTGKVLVRHFRHKPTKQLASGRKVISTRTAVLVNVPLQPRERGLQLARMTDIDVKNRQYGISFYTHGKAMNAAINDLTSMSMRNSKQMAHPRWVVPRGSVIKKDALGNDITIIEYQGPTAPAMVAPPPMNQELTMQKSDLKQDLQQILGSGDYARGEVQSNVRSALMAQALSEQEAKRSNSGVSKHATFIRDVIENSMNVAASWYEKDDKRMLPVVGRDNRYLVQEFDPSHLTKAYDVRVTNKTGMPDSKAAGVEMLVELGKAYPGLVTPQKVVELLQWGNSDGFMEISTASIKAAEAENESLLNDEEPEEPTIYEDLIVHWTSHVQEMANRSFKTHTPKNVQEKFVAHTAGTELLMMEAAKRNPAFALKLMELPQFPMFYTPSVEEFILLDAARTGNPLNLQQVDMLMKLGPVGLQQVPGQTPPAGAQPQSGGPNNGVLQVGPTANNAVAQAQTAPQT